MGAWLLVSFGRSGKDVLLGSAGHAGIGGGLSWGPVTSRCSDNRRALRAADNDECADDRGDGMVLEWNEPVRESGLVGLMSCWPDNISEPTEVDKTVKAVEADNLLMLVRSERAPEVAVPTVVSDPLRPKVYPCPSLRDTVDGFCDVHTLDVRSRRESRVSRRVSANWSCSDSRRTAQVSLV
jgi:hypothetical protein